NGVNEVPRIAKNQIKFTKQEVANLPFTEKGSVVYHDTVVKGLVVIVYTNSKTFHVYKFVGGKPIKPKLGSFPDMTVEQARKEAAQVLGSIAKGERVHSKNVSKPTGVPTLGKLFERYIDEYARHHCTTWQETQKNFRRYFEVWLSTSVNQI